MKLSKYDHACFTVEKEGSTIVVDPGNLTANLVRQRSVVGIVITHEHADHFDSRIITAILDENPEAQIFSTATVVPQLAMYDVHVPAIGEKRTVGPFTLQFFGGHHAVIHESIAQIENYGLLIDETLYYPGDSFALPATLRPPHILVPVAAPWLKIAETIDFLRALRPAVAYPTHDGILSQDGKTIVDGLLAQQTALYGGQYQRIAQPVDL